MVSLLRTHSNELADAAQLAGRAVVQTLGGRRPASGVVYAEGLILTSARALGRDDGLVVRTEDGKEHPAELRGWDPGTGLAVLRATSVTSQPIAPAREVARVGHLALAIGRSWSNALTVSAGVVSVIGGPLRTGRGRAIDRVIRTTAPMHDGFAGGAFVDVTGGLLGIATAARIRGLGVILPVEIASKIAASLVEHGSTRRGYLGLAGQAVRLSDRQREATGSSSSSSSGLLVVAVAEGSPADAAGLLVGDVLVEFDGRPVPSPIDLLELLYERTAGQAVPLRVLRGGQLHEVTITIGDKRASEAH